MNGSTGGSSNDSRSVRPSATLTARGPDIACACAAHISR